MIYEKSCGAVIYTVKDGQRLYLAELMRKGHVSICKGHVEEGESEHETASREIFEETGLRVEFDEHLELADSVGQHAFKGLSELRGKQHAAGFGVFDQLSELDGVEFLVERHDDAGAADRG